MERAREHLDAPLTRRRFIGGLASAAAALWVPRAWGSPSNTVLDGRDPGSLSPLEREHLVHVTIPDVTTHGSKVPIVVEIDHPMTADHFIRTIRVINPRDPVPSKGTFHFTPANGRAYVSFQARMHHGTSRVAAMAECSRHGSWSTSRTIVVPEEGGG